jgi:exodeoxyribonuclease VII large subunit
VLIWPVAVQGKSCAPEVTRAIEGFNAMTRGGALPRPDLLIVARGGGSLEDLWGFNEENVARAAAASTIPLISAVGHETDTTLIDFVSDVRAPTPTAAAELAVPVRHELLALVSGQEARMAQALSNLLSMRRQRLRDLGRALPRPDGLLETPRQKLDLWGDRLPAGLIQLVQLRRLRVSERAGSLRPALLHRAVRGEDKRLQTLAPRLAPGLMRVVASKREALGRRSDRLNVAPLHQDLGRKSKDLTRLAGRLSDAGTRQIDSWQERIAALDRLRETLGSKATLRRGYAVVHRDGRVVTTKKAARVAMELEVEFADGRMRLVGKPARRVSKPDPEAGPPQQGDLF